MNPFAPRALRPLSAILAAAFAASWLAPSAGAQVVNPADKAKSSERSAQDKAAAPADHTTTYSMPPAVVEGQRVSELREEDRIGENQQPRWTAKRRFTATRVYVVPEGTVEFEWWARVERPRHGPTTMQNQYEWEFGLPNRIQVDLYAASNQTIDQGPMAFDEQKIEVRYGFAQWGKLWGNPAAYIEWDQRSNEADVVEYKLLFGDQLATGWHWGANLIYEQTIGDNRDSEYGLSLGLSHTLQDEKLSIGAEIKTDIVDTNLDRGNFEKEFEIGPSLQWRPVPAMHLDFAPLVGIGPDSRRADVFFVLGWEF